MKLGIEGKVALVLGSSQGLGYAIAKTLKEEGAKVVLCSRSADKLKKAKEEIQAEGFIAADLNLKGEARRVVEECQKKYGAVDILLCNTGGPDKTSFELATDSMWQSAFDSLWLSTTEAIRASLGEMKKNKWGRILLVTSVAAKEPLDGLTLSNALRAGLLGMTKSLSNEIAQFGITVNALMPGFTDTERLRELKIPPEKICAQIPARRIGNPEEFAALAAFLASNQASYITGQAIACDGGFMKSI